MYPQPITLLSHGNGERILVPDISNKGSFGSLQMRRRTYRIRTAPMYPEFGPEHRFVRMFVQHVQCALVSCGELQAPWLPLGVDADHQGHPEAVPQHTV